jgi:hypothetical protein
MRTPWTAWRQARGRDVVIVALAAGIAIGGLLLPATTGANSDAITANSALPSRPVDPVPGGPTRIRISPIPIPAPLGTVSGWSVTAIGDSLMVGSAAALKAALPGVFIYARVGRQFSDAIAVLFALKAQKMLRKVVVIALGTNGTVTAAQVRTVVHEVGPRRTLVLVNTFEPRFWEASDNAVMAAAARGYPNVIVANWYDAIRHRTYLLAADGVHPGPVGSVLWARVIEAAVERTASPVA